MKSDPDESRNLVASPGSRDRLRIMSDLMDKLKLEFGWLDYEHRQPGGYYVLGGFSSVDEAEKARETYLSNENSIDFDARIGTNGWIWTTTGDVGAILSRQHHHGFLTKLLGGGDLIGFIAIPVTRESEREYFTTIASAGTEQPLVCYYNGEKVYENRANARYEGRSEDVDLVHNWLFYHNHPLDKGHNNILLRVVVGDPTTKMNFNMTAPEGTLTFPTRKT